MPYTHEHKQQSRERILKSAVRLFTRRGFDNTSIDDVMADAELTRGAFYAHFKSKQDLYTQAITGAQLFSIFNQPKPDELGQQAWLLKLINAYLSNAHVKKADIPCPLAFLITDVAINEQAPRQAYTDVYLKMNRLMRTATKNNRRLDTETVMAITTLMIGGVAIARTLTDDKAQAALLRGCRRVITELMGLEA